MARYRHYENSKEPGVTLFITTTVLDFVHAFRRDEPRTAMALEIALECKLLRARLYGYVVMPHHVHMVVGMHEKMNGPRFMRHLKRESSPSILKLLTEEELRAFDEQRGLNGNTFWKYSFRSIVLESEAMFWQRMNYLHMNPVKAGYVESPEDYRWSSARLVVAGHLCLEKGLPYEAVVRSLQ
jgi:putative transposase